MVPTIGAPCTLAFRSIPLLSICSLYSELPHIQIYRRSFCFPQMYRINHLAKIASSSISTDSRSTVEALSSLKLSKNQSFIILSIKNQSKITDSVNLKIAIIWITAHKGILGNETADLAKRAIRFGTTLLDPIPHSDFYSIPKAKLHNNFSIFLSSKPTGKTYFEFYPPNPSHKPWFHKLDWKRDVITTACRIRNNHYNLNGNLFKYNIVTSPLCDCGCLNQDVSHVLWDCSQRSSGKDLLFSSIQKSIHKPPPYNIFSLLTDPTFSIASSILSFLHTHALHL